MAVAGKQRGLVGVLRTRVWPCILPRSWTEGGEHPVRYANISIASSRATAAGGEVIAHRPSEAFTLTIRLTRSRTSPVAHIHGQRTPRLRFLPPARRSSDAT